MEELLEPSLELLQSEDYVDEDDEFVLEGDSTTDSDSDEEEIYEVEIHPDEVDEFMQELKEIKGLSTGSFFKHCRYFRRIGDVTF